MHVDLRQCKLIRNAGKNGKLVGECFRFSKRRGWDYEQKKGVEKGGFSLATVEALYEYVGLKCIMFTSKRPQQGRGGKEEDPPGGMVTPSLAVIYEVEF